MLDFTLVTALRQFALGAECSFNFNAAKCCSPEVKKCGAPPTHQFWSQSTLAKEEDLA
jgi:hypothetical protein